MEKPECTSAGWLSKELPPLGRVLWGWLSMGMMNLSGTWMLAQPQISRFAPNELYTTLVTILDVLCHNCWVLTEQTHSASAIRGRYVLTALGYLRDWGNSRCCSVSAHASSGSEKGYRQKALVCVASLCTLGRKWHPSRHQCI